MNPRLSTPRGFMDARRPADPARRRALGWLAAVPLVAGPLAACTTSAPPQAMPSAGPAQLTPAPRVGVGDRWRYAEINGFNGIRQAEVACEVVETAPRLRVRQTDSRGRARPDEVYVSPWSVVEEPFYDQPQVFEQPMPVVPAQILSEQPVVLVETAWRSPQLADRFLWQQQLATPRWERLRVPAGEFETLRIERRMWLTHPDRLRAFRTERWESLWYAPQVNRWVRREWSGQYRWAGMRRGAPLREDWIVWELLEHAPAAA